MAGWIGHHDVIYEVVSPTCLVVVFIALSLYLADLISGEAAGERGLGGGCVRGGRSVCGDHQMVVVMVAGGGGG